MKVLIIGSYPPPYGGVTTHIKKLARILSSNGYNIRILDVINKRYIRISKNIFVIPISLTTILHIIRIFISSKIVHIHTSGYGKYWREAILITLSKLTKNKIIVTIHGGSFPHYISKNSKIDQFFIKYWLKHSHKIILVNQLQKDAINKLIGNNINQKVSVIPAFLPENINYTKSKKINKPKQEQYNILVMGNWMEIYGLNTFINALKIIIDEGTNIKAYILIYIFSEPDLDYKNKIESLIDTLNLKNYIEFLQETDDMSSVYNMMDIFIRPTNADGDSLSVREAISYGLPVIASDVCERPSLSILFKKGDYIDLSEKIRYVLNNYGSIYEYNCDQEQQNFAEDIIQIYRDLS